MNNLENKVLLTADDLPRLQGQIGHAEQQVKAWQREARLCRKRYEAAKYLASLKEPVTVVAIPPAWVSDGLVPQAIPKVGEE